jgi:hypothetical protein
VDRCRSRCGRRQIEHRGEKLERRGAACDHVKQPQEQHHPAVGQPIEEPQLPQRPAAVKWWRVEVASQRLFVAGRWEHSRHDVMGDVAAGVVLPCGCPVPPGGPNEHLMQALDISAGLLDAPADLLDRSSPASSRNGCPASNASAAMCIGMPRSSMRRLLMSRGLMRSAESSR